MISQNMESLIILLVVILVGIFVYRVYKSKKGKHKSPTKSTESRDVEWRIRAAKRRRFEAEARADAAKKGMVGKIWRSFRDNLRL